MNTELPILLIPDEFKHTDFSLISNFGTLQLWIANNVPGNTSQTIYVFVSQNFSNIVATYYYSYHLTFHYSSSGIFTITTSTHVSLEDKEIDFSLWFYYVF